MITGDKLIYVHLSHKEQKGNLRPPGPKPTGTHRSAPSRLEGRVLPGPQPICSPQLACLQPALTGSLDESQGYPLGSRSPQPSPTPLSGLGQSVCARRSLAAGAVCVAAWRKVRRHRTLSLASQRVQGSHQQQGRALAAGSTPRPPPWAAHCFCLQATEGRASPASGRPHAPEGPCFPRAEGQAPCRVRRRMGAGSSLGSWPLARCGGNSLVSQEIF